MTALRPRNSEVGQTGMRSTKAQCISKCAHSLMINSPGAERHQAKKKTSFQLGTWIVLDCSGLFWTRLYVFKVTPVQFSSFSYFHCAATLTLSVGTREERNVISAKFWHFDQMFPPAATAVKIDCAPLNLALVPAACFLLQQTLNTAQQSCA